MIRYHIGQAEGQRIRVRVTGHAGYAEEGKDIICAGASMLLYALAQAEKNAGELISFRQDAGNAELLIQKSGDTMKRLEVYSCGMAMLRENYPDHATITKQPEARALPAFFEPCQGRNQAAVRAIMKQASKTASERSEDMSLITTTVCVDAQKPATQAVVHLSQGDSGTRTLRMIPVEGGCAVSLQSAVQAKVRAHPLSGGSDLLLNAELGGYYADLTPTPALVAGAEEWRCQLLLLDGQDQTLSSMPFTILIHAGVYSGDTVEHTNTTVSEIRYDAENMQLIIALADGTTIAGPSMAHTHPLATSEAPGFMSAVDFDFVQGLKSEVNQDVRTTAEPTFAGLTIGSLHIDGTTGEITGLRFT